LDWLLARITVMPLSACTRGKMISGNGTKSRHFVIVVLGLRLLKKEFPEIRIDRWWGTRAPVYSSNWNRLKTNFCYNQKVQKMWVFWKVMTCILLWKSCECWIRVSGHNSQRKRLFRHAATSAWCNLHEEILTSIARLDPLVHQTKQLSCHFYWERLDSRKLWVSKVQ
jgi:hypothetical protein